MANSYNSQLERSYQQTTNESMNRSLSVHVGNLSLTTTEDQLRTILNEKIGHVNRVRILYDKRTHSSRGFGFIQFDTLESCRAAINLGKCQLNGRDISISSAESNTSSESNVVSTNANEHVQTTRTHVVHCKKSNYDVYIGRPSDWGNPFVIGKDGDRADVIRKYRQWINRQPDLIARAKKELRGKRIACWCKPDACHGDILAEIANAS
jgi:RNA recognition motif-containing protein